MAIQKLDRTFTPKAKEIRYLNKTFPEIRQSLIDFARVYYPDTYNDFNEASPGMMFIEMASYVGDVLSYYIDTQFRENLLEYAQEPSNIISIAQSLGFKPKPATAATTDLDVYQVCPAQGLSGNYEPDPRYYLRINEGMVVSAPGYNVQFRTSQILDFADPTDRVISVYTVDGLNKPATYLIKKTIQVSAGTIKEYRHTFGTPERFSVLTLPDPDVLEIISVVDANGYTWSEVDFLAQDLIFDEQTNTRVVGVDESLAPYSILKIKRTARRFVTRYDGNLYCELHFGSGVLDDSNDSINLDPKKIASDEYENNLASTSLDPSDFLSSRSYGLAPSNTELLVTYAVGGGISSNVPSNSIVKLDTIQFLNDSSGFTAPEAALFADIKNSLAVNNPVPATGGKDADSVDEMRQNALAFFNAQNRLVTAQDYTVRCYAMPPKFGGVAKVFVARDEQLNDIMRATNSLPPTGGQYVLEDVLPNVVNLYVLGYNQNKKLVILNADTKKNLRMYLDQYRILTDEVRILDAFVVNIGVKFDIVVYKGYNLSEVLARCISTVSDFFDIDKWDINQPIIKSDLLLQIAQVDGVQNVKDVSLFNRYQYKDGIDYENYLYDLDAATENGVVYPSLDPCIFELRYPERDIIGNASQ